MFKFLSTTLAAVAIACIHATAAHATDWLQFGYDSSHSGYNRAEAGYSTAAGNKALYHYPLPAAAADPTSNYATGNDPQGHGGTAGDEIKAQPAIWANPADGSTWAYVVNPNGMAAYQLTIPVSGTPFLTQKWTAGGGTSPVIANSTVYYMSASNKLLVLDAVTGTSIVSNTSSWGSATFSGSHWQSPTLVNGRVYLIDSHTPAQVWVYQLDGAFESGFE